MREYKFSNQVKLIDADKILWELALQGFMTDDIKRKIDEGKFDPDTPPVPTIKPGDKDLRAAKEEIARINCDYYADKQRFHDRGRELAAEKERADKAEAREQKLMEAIDKAIREYGLWHDEGSAANVMVEILHNAISSLYPKEETK